MDHIANMDCGREEQGQEHHFHSYSRETDLQTYMQPRIDV